MKRLLHVTTVPMTLRFLRGQVGYLVQHGFEVHVLSSPGEGLTEFGREEGVECHAVEMPRRISPLLDLVALSRVRHVMQWLRPAIVHAHTPKGGLLGILGAWLARVPVRVYHIHGLPMDTAEGARRALLALAEKVSCRFATQVLCVSHSVRAVVIERGLCPPEKIKVLGAGSINGVDATGRFDPEVMRSSRRPVREQYGIPEQARVIGYIGRIVRDKGIVELAKAWQLLRAVDPEAHLLLVGPWESGDPIPPHVEEQLHDDERVHIAGPNWNTPPLYAAMDVAVLPSYREGLPVVPLEAAAMGLPVVATDIPGCRDAVADGLTGTLVPVGDVEALRDAIHEYLRSSALREQHGAAGRARMLQHFRPERIWKATLEEYHKLLENLREPEEQGNRSERDVFV